MWAALEDLDPDNNSPGARQLRRMHAAAMRQIYFEHRKRLEGRGQVKNDEASSRRSTLPDPGYWWTMHTVGLEGDPPATDLQRDRGEQESLLEALTGDPLDGPGYEARNALYKEALRWLDMRTRRSRSQAEGDGGAVSLVRGGSAQRSVGGRELRGIQSSSQRVRQGRPGCSRGTEAEDGDEGMIATTHERAQQENAATATSMPRAP